MSARGDLVDSKTAAAMLRVKPQTLYAYVSRGLIRTQARPGSKERLYFLEDLDIARLKGRRVGPIAARQDPVGGALTSGAIALTSITAIGPRGPLYRGWAAVDLVQQHRAFEDCVELLWGGVLPMRRTAWKPAAPEAVSRAFAQAIAQVAARNSSRRLMSVVAEAHAASTGRSAEAVHGAPVLAGRELIQVLAPVFGLLAEQPCYVATTREESIAQVVARASGIAVSDEATDAIDACLILCADHEFAPSTLAARIAASAGADLFACVNSALGAFEGPLTGMGCDDAEQVVRTASSAKAYLEKIRRKRDRNEPISGYGHPLYPDGDPRAALLLMQARELAGSDPAARHVFDCIDAVQSSTGMIPNLALGLVAMATALCMPRQSPGALMALGRTAGWVAHALEQRISGFLGRPRARYIGPPPVQP